MTPLLAFLLLALLALAFARAMKDSLAPEIPQVRETLATEFRTFNWWTDFAGRGLPERETAPQLWPDDRYWQSEWAID